MFYWFLKYFYLKKKAKKIGDNPCQSNFDKRSSNFSSFSVTYLIVVSKEYIETKNLWNQILTLKCDLTQLMWMTPSNVKFTEYYILPLLLVLYCMFSRNTNPEFLIFVNFLTNEDVLITEIQQITKRKLIWTVGNSGNFGNGFPIFFANK